METIYTVLIFAGFIVSSFIFFSSLVVTLLTRYRLEKNRPANREWLTPNWLAILFGGFGAPYFFLGVLLWNRGEQSMVLITTVVALTIGFFLGRKVEEELRDYGKSKSRRGSERKKNPRRR